jgi:hypothetical protein
MEQVSSQAEAVAHRCFALVAARFPLLRIERDELGLELKIPVQPGLKHEVVLSFQNADELHLSVGHFWLEWFPCTDPERADQYLEAVCGFLAGVYRIIEHYRGSNCIKAELQRPVGAGWKTVGTWSKLRWPSFSRAECKVIANA